MLDLLSPDTPAPSPAMLHLGDAWLLSFGCLLRRSWIELTFKRLKNNKFTGRDYG